MRHDIQTGIDHDIQTEISHFEWMAAIVSESDFGSGVPPGTWPSIGAVLCILGVCPLREALT